MADTKISALPTATPGDTDLIPGVQSGADKAFSVGAIAARALNNGAASASTLTSHTSNTSNPHAVTSSQVGANMDFGNDYIDALATDGADMSIRVIRNMTVLDGDVGFDANPAQTMTITLQQRRSGSVIATATLSVSTGGVITKSGFSITGIAAGDRLRVNISGTANVTGLNYVFKAREA